MAISAPVVVNRSVAGNERVVTADYTFSSTVAAGGDAVTLPSPMSKVNSADVNALSNVAFGHQYDITNGKMMVWQGTAAYTGAATHVVRATFRGR